MQAKLAALGQDATQPGLWQFLEASFQGELSVPASPISPCSLSYSCHQVKEQPQPSSPSLVWPPPRPWTV